MSRRFCRRTLGVLAIASCVPLAAGAQVQATPEEFARRQVPRAASSSCAPASTQKL